MTTKLDIWKRLRDGRGLTDLESGDSSGRIDLRGLQLPDPVVVRQVKVSGAQVSEIAGEEKIQGITWRGVDFTGSKLNGLRLVDCEIENCVFDECQLRDLRMWSTRVSQTSFVGS